MPSCIPDSNKHEKHTSIVFLLLIPVYAAIFCSTALLKCLFNCFEMFFFWEAGKAARTILTVCSFVKF